MLPAFFFGSPLAWPGKALRRRAIPDRRGTDASAQHVLVTARVQMAPRGYRWPRAPTDGPARLQIALRGVQMPLRLCRCDCDVKHRTLR
jgi:hypothetical protein